MYQYPLDFIEEMHPWNMIMARNASEMTKKPHLYFKL
jgi:hypothetical protein